MAPSRLRTISSFSRKSTVSSTTLSIPNIWDVVPKNVSRMKSTMPSSESASPVARIPSIWVLMTFPENSFEAILSVSCST